MTSSQAILAVAHGFFKLWSASFQLVNGKTYQKCIFQ